MYLAQYFNYKLGHHGSPNRVGGQPTHLPSTKPWPSSEDAQWCFLFQLRVFDLNLELHDAEFLQFYQPLDESVEPVPRLITIPFSADLNLQNVVNECPNLEQWRIEFEEASDPVELPAYRNLETAKLMKSKIGGLDPWGSQETFVMQIAEGIVGFNFGGMMCSLYQEAGRLVVKMN